MTKQIDSIPIGELKNSILVVKVGSDEHPAAPQDIQNVLNSFRSVLEDIQGARVIVTHHCLDFSILSLKGLPKKSKKEKKLKDEAEKKVNNSNSILLLET